MISGSVRAFTLKRIRAGLPAFAAAATSWISSIRPSAQAEGRDEQLAEALRPSEASDVVEEVGDVGGDVLVGREEAEVLVDTRRESVVVARAEVDVTAEHSLLLAHDQRHLRVDLQAGKPVDDVDAGPLEGARPLDVLVLVEASLELDQADALLAGLGALHEGRDER